MTVITISRFTGRGGEKLAKCFSEGFSIPAVRCEVVAQVANRLAITEAVLSQQLEERKGLFGDPSPERLSPGNDEAPYVLFQRQPIRNPYRNGKY